MKMSPIVFEATNLFRQGLAELFQEVDVGALTAESFGELIEGLKTVGNRALLAAFVDSVEASDRGAVAVLERDGKAFRFKATSTKRWLTPFDLAAVSRRYDQRDVGGDGVTVPMREEGVRCGRPPERPGIRDQATSPTRWREAGVGIVSIYAAPEEGEQTPDRVDGRVFARMPEPHMQTLERQMEGVVWDLTQTRDFREVVLICDGKRTLWDDLCPVPSYEKATKILDPYHAAEHLSRAAEAIFDKDDPDAKKGFERYRHRLVHEHGGVDATIRSLRHHRGKLRRGSQRDDVVRRVNRYPSRYRDKMCYAESAAKTMVNGRLKRSGMRWSQDRGQNVLNLRTAVKSNRWNALWIVYQGAVLRPAA